MNNLWLMMVGLWLMMVNDGEFMSLRHDGLMAWLMHKIWHMMINDPRDLDIFTCIDMNSGWFMIGDALIMANHRDG